MLRIVICEDDAKDLAYIKQIVDAYCAAHVEHSFRVEGFANSSQMLDALEQGAVWDIALLDIYLPGILGTYSAVELRQRLKQVELIFLTNSQDFAVEAFALGAVHYLVKPFTAQQLAEALDRALANCAEANGQRLVLHLGNGAPCIVRLGEIEYIESIERCRVVHTAAGELTEQRQSLSALYEQLCKMSPGQFIAPYRGYVVNQNEIRTITTQGIVMRSGAVIPLKEGDFRRTREAFFAWLFPENKRGGEVE